MPREMSLLVWAVGLTAVQLLIVVIGANLQVGTPTLVGNRETAPHLTGWACRAKRAHQNMLESLPLFAVLVLAAQATNRLDATTLLGAQVFFWARVAYAVVYVAGITWVRSAIWGVGLLGLVLIFSRLV